MKVAILTLGCKVNQAESAFIAGGLSKRGMEVVDLSGQPDYSVINTCTVTAKSDYQSRQLIRRAARTGAKVIVTGCYSQVNPGEVRQIEGVFDIVPNTNKYSIIDMLDDNISSSTLFVSGRSRPYVKVQDGCNNACSYCIVPKARGRSRSIGIPSILKMISELETQGYQEIVLTGINLGAFGRDLQPESRLVNLLRSILDRTRIRRIRLSSLELNEVDEEIIELLHEPRICKHLHIPLQSGDDSILRLMNRKYAVRDFISAIERISKSVKNIAIGTDIIVGFPGEGDPEFSHTRETIESLPLAYIHIFPFSARPMTVASRMTMQNATSTRKERFAVLNAVNIKKKEEYMSSQLRKILDIVIEVRCPDGSVLGTSSNYLKVRTTSDGHRKGSLIYVGVSRIEDGVLTGDVIGNP
jgi:threonylcarbamoyladenosine tRNA methylthiotransferase MtaB